LKQALARWSARLRVKFLNRLEGEGPQNKLVVCAKNEAVFAGCNYAVIRITTQSRKEKESDLPCRFLASVPASGTTNVTTNVSLSANVSVEGGEPNVCSKASLRRCR
jgi:hypothetical protein